MWKVYCDEHLIYSTTIESLKLFSAKLDVELNKTGSFVFTIYPSHPHYNKIKKLESIIKVYSDDYLMFRGRVLNDQKLFHNQKEVTCEGELAFLIDSKQRPYDFQSGNNHTTIKDFLTYLIEEHNKQMLIEFEGFTPNINKTFKVGNVTVTDPNDYIVRADSTYLNTWESVNQKLLDTNEGYLFVRHEKELDENGKEIEVSYIDYLKDFDTLSNQKIEFGKNLLDFNETIKGEVVATAIIPLGEGTEDSKLTIAEINNGIDYVYNVEAVKKYGWIFATVEWADVTDALNLKTKAEEYLNDAINLLVSLELSAVDLATLNKEFNSFKLGTYVYVKSKPHGVDSKFLVTKLSIDLLNPKNNKLTLGKTYLTFTEKTNANAIQKEMVNTVKKESVSKKEMQQAIVETEERTSTSISQSADEIILQVNTEYALKEDVEEVIESVNTQFTQNSESFEMRFNQFNQDIEDVTNEVDAQFQEISKYIRFVDGNIILGEEGNELVLKIENDRIAFLQNSVEVAYFSNKKLYVLDGEFINSLKIGKFAFLPRTNGNLSLKKFE